MSWGHVELEPEVEKWFLGLTHSHRGTVAFYVDLLADHGVHLGEPYTRQLSGKVVGGVRRAGTHRRRGVTR
ncbi:hypothetical protein [Streptomyces zaomyceticus]|uniref:hypothetical protein n=1 Tax=Streptomyces zaomyceticus TaxID=68286 RepID=UPI0033B44597